MKLQRFEAAIDRLKKELPNWSVPAARGCEYRYERTPFTILISVMLSYRTKDEVTCEAANRLLSKAPTPKRILALESSTIARLIYPVGFYNQKARQIRAVAKALQERYSGMVPNSLEELTKLPGVGVKAAKIVLERGFGEPVVAVDSHVHRILNRWGFIQTKRPEQTDRKLEELLPPKLRPGLNRTLVAFGQAICHPKGPECHSCPIKDLVPCST